MSNVAPIKIDTTDGRLPIKDKGLVFQEFANPAEERRNQLEKLAAGFRLFDYFGFNEGVAGHITYRDPEFQDHFWVNPLGVHFSQISVSDLLLVNHDGKVVQGDRDVNVAAFAIHSRLHKARPDVMLQHILILFTEELFQHLGNSLILFHKMLVLFTKIRVSIKISQVWSKK